MSHPQTPAVTILIFTTPIPNIAQHLLSPLEGLSCLRIFLDPPSLAACFKLARFQLILSDQQPDHNDKISYFARQATCWSLALPGC